MRIITDKPIIYQNQEYSNLDDAAKAGLLTAGVGGAVALGTALIGRQRTATDIEQVCGKKPKVGKKKKEAWQKCADANSGGGTKAPITSTDNNQQQPQGMSSGAKVGLAIGGLVVVGLVIFLIARKKKK